MTDGEAPRPAGGAGGAGEEGGPAGDGGPRMSFLEHLDELRRRLLFCFVAALAGLVACWFVADRILAFLLDPVAHAMGPLAVIRPAEAFMAKVKASFVGGIFVALPIFFWQLWAFVSPGLYPRERRWVVPVMVVGTVLFLAGAAFCYWIAMPAAVDFLASQGEQFEFHVTVDYAFSFAAKLLLGLGVVFEMPLVVFALARLGLVSARFLWRKLDIAIFVCFVVAAVITPTPDVMTMTLFAAPMIVLYLVSIVVAALADPFRRERKGRRRDPEGTR